MPSDDSGISGGPPAAGSAGPLHGFRVVELAMWVAGPSAAGTLADWGRVTETAQVKQRPYSAPRIALRPRPPFEIQ